MSHHRLIRQLNFANGVVKHELITPDSVKHRVRNTRDKVSRELSWLPDESQEESANLPDPEEIAIEIVADLRAALEEFEAILDELAVDA